jgi:hypothetical protein
VSYKKLIIPIGTALTALIANASQTSINPADSQSDSSELQDATRTGKDLRDPVIKQLLYQMEGQAHTLILHKPSFGVIYATHGSHRSHGSHGSHRSHRSGR